MKQPLSRQDSDINSILDQDQEIKRLVNKKLGPQVQITNH